MQLTVQTVNIQKLYTSDKGDFMIKKLNLNVSAFILSIIILITSFSGCELINGDSELSNGKSYPIVLVHGFIGWGRDEVGGPYGHYYWGGYDDLQEILRKAGHDCYTGVVGPFSSNWDRACELYAQLKGVRTDYGLAHSIKHKHERFGIDFSNKALLKNKEGKSDWGSAGSHKKIHIIAHSQGAQTVRMLAQLLENGFQEEISASYPAENPISPLFKGTPETKNLVHSITTLAGVQNGTTLANSVDKLVPMILDIVANLMAVIGIDENDTVFNVYDFKLQQFGFKSRQQNETIKDYLARMKIAVNGFLSSNTKDICLWDLSPEGAREQNEWVHTQDNIYYFSYAGKSTHKALLPDVLDNWEKHQVPDLNNPIFFAPFNLMMGSFTCNDSRYHGLWRAKDYEFYNMLVKDRPKIDSSWWENDGVVNTKSMNGPWLYPDSYTGKRDVINNWDKKSIPIKGIWNYGGVFSNLDHFDIIGLEILKSDKDNFNSPEFTKHAEDWYLSWADVLKSLE